MARNLARIPYIEDIPSDPDEIVEAVNTRITEINRILIEVEADLNQQKGNDGAEPVFNNAPNLREHRITNGERSKEPRDFVIRQELIDLGLVGDASGNIVFSGGVEFAGQATVSGPTGGSGGLVTGSDLEGAINTAIGANVATSRDGDRLSIEDITGANGTSDGTSILARNGSGKAKFVQMRGNDILVHDEELATAIFELREEIKDLRKLLTSD